MNLETFYILAAILGIASGYGLAFTRATAWALALRKKWQDFLEPIEKMGRAIRAESSG